MQRVLSGEKVVMSDYLGADRASSSASMTGESQTKTGQSKKLFDKEETDSIQDQQDSAEEVKEASKARTNNRITLKRDDPLPSSVASRIVGSENLLREVTDKLYVFLVTKYSLSRLVASLIIAYNYFVVFCSNEGRPLMSEEIALLQQEIGKLYNELNCIDFIADNTPQEEDSVIA